MRELAVRIQFTKHCLGNVKKFHWEKGKKRYFFLLPRSPEGRVIFLATWWTAVLIKAAEVLCHFQDDVRSVKFSLEVDGLPRPVPEEFYRRFYEGERFSKHEAFFPGDCIGLTCIVPSTISDENFQRLMTIVGKYYGISPARPNEYGYFTVLSVQPCGPRRTLREQLTITENSDVVLIKSEPPG
jgi:hypothetical protein